MHSRKGCWLKLDFYKAVNKSDKELMRQTESARCCDYFHILLILTHWYSFLWVVRVNVSGPWRFCTLVSPSDRWITVDMGADDVTSSGRLKGTSVSWPGWSRTSYLGQNGTVVCNIKRNNNIYCKYLRENPITGGVTVKGTSNRVWLFCPEMS